MVDALTGSTLTGSHAELTVSWRGQTAHGLLAGMSDLTRIAAASWPANWPTDWDAEGTCSGFWPGSGTRDLPCVVGFPFAEGFSHWALAPLPSPRNALVVEPGRPAHRAQGERTYSYDFGSPRHWSRAWKTPPAAPKL